MICHLLRQCVAAAHFLLLVVARSLVGDLAPPGSGLSHPYPGIAGAASWRLDVGASLLVVAWKQSQDERSSD